MSGWRAGWLVMLFFGPFEHFTTGGPSYAREWHRPRRTHPTFSLTRQDGRYNLTVSWCQCESRPPCRGWCSSRDGVLVRSRRRTPSRRQSPPSGRFPSAPLSSTLEFLTKTHVVRKIVPRRWAHENVLTGRGHRPFSPAEALQLGFASALGLDPPFISCISLITELAADLGTLGHYRISARACVFAWLCRGALEDRLATYYA